VHGGSATSTFAGAKFENASLVLKPDRERSIATDQAEKLTGDRRAYGLGFVCLDRAMVGLPAGDRLDVLGRQVNMRRRVDRVDRGQQSVA
jgi:hypothetical protein